MAQGGQPRLRIIEEREVDHEILSMDVHPDTEKPWILASHADGNVSIWNYRTLERVTEFRVSDVVGTDTEGLTHWICCAKFIPRERWIVAGGGDGYIYVFSERGQNSSTRQDVKKFKAHGDVPFFMGEDDVGYWVNSLAVHPNQPYLLSASQDNLIKLWNWNADWACLWTFSGHDHFVKHVMFSPDGTTFASASEDWTVKIWNIREAEPTATLACGEDTQQHVAFFSRCHRQCIITGSLKGAARVWDMRRKSRPIKKIKGTTPKRNELDELESEVHGCNVGVINFGQVNVNPVLITVSNDLSISFHDATTYQPRFAQVNCNGHGPPQDFAYIKSIKSLAIAYSGAIAILDMNEEMGDNTNGGGSAQPKKKTPVVKRKR